MQGIFSKLPSDTLAVALVPVAERCDQLDWTVDLYSGPLQHPYGDDDEPNNLLPYFHEQNGLPMGWFARGFLPRYADCLILDEWSYYLGFDSAKLCTAELARRLRPNMDLQPRAELFQLVDEENLLFLLRVDTGWWEAYTPDTNLLEQLRIGWDGSRVNSDRWSTGMPTYPSK